MLLAALLMIASAPQDGCVTTADAPLADDSTPLQPAGSGLWIGGLPFNPADIETVTVTHDDVTDQWLIELRFTAAGNARFIQAQRCGVGRMLEISVDRKLISRPYLREQITGGRPQISANWSDRAEADALAARITRR